MKQPDGEEFLSAVAVAWRHEEQHARLREDQFILLNVGCGKTHGLMLWAFVLGEYVRLCEALPPEVSVAAASCDDALVESVCGSSVDLLRAADPRSERAVLLRDRLESLFVGLSRIGSPSRTDALRFFSSELRSFGERVSSHRSRDDLEVLLISSTPLHEYSTWIPDFRPTVVGYMRSERKGRARERANILHFSQGSRKSLAFLSLWGDYQRLGERVPSSLRSESIDLGEADSACAEGATLLACFGGVGASVLLRDQLESLRVGAEAHLTASPGLRTLQRALLGYDARTSAELSRPDVERTLGSRLALHDITSWLMCFERASNEVACSVRPVEPESHLPNDTEVARYIAYGEFHEVVEAAARSELEFERELVALTDAAIACRSRVSLVARHFLQVRQREESVIWLDGPELSLGTVEQLGCRVSLRQEVASVSLFARADKKLHAVRFLTSEASLPDTRSEGDYLWRVDVPTEAGTTGMLVLRGEHGATFALLIRLERQDR